MTGSAPPLRRVHGACHSHDRAPSPKVEDAAEVEAKVAEKAAGADAVPTLV